ncbi:MAG: DUF58 domain-containing protein [Thermoguttaceae bacterium]
MAAGLVWALRHLGTTRQRAGTTITGQGLYYLAFLAVVFTVAFLGRVNLLMILAGMVLGPLWFSWRWVAADLRGLELGRRMPRSICAGDLLLVDLELANRRRAGSWAVWVQERISREGGAEGAGPLEPSVYFPYVAPGQSRRRTYRARLPQRGRYRFDRPAVFTRFPFGLFRRTTFLGQAQTLWVYPRLGQLSPQWAARHREWFEGSQRRERRHGRTSGDFYGVRPWRSGDSRRHIHWRSSARRGTLVVRQFDRHRNPDVAILVDLWQPRDAQPEDLDNVELAVSFAATLVADLCRKGGANLVVGTTADEGLLCGPASAALLQDALEALAVAQASPTDRLADWLARATRGIEPGSQLILVSTRSLDLADRQRFGLLWDDPARRALVSRMRVISAAEEHFQEYFQPA